MRIDSTENLNASVLFGVLAPAPGIVLDADLLLFHGFSLYQQEFPLRPSPKEGAGSLASLWRAIGKPPAAKCYLCFLLGHLRLDRYVSFGLLLNIFGNCFAYGMLEPSMPIDVKWSVLEKSAPTMPAKHQCFTILHSRQMQQPCICKPENPIQTKDEIKLYLASKFWYVQPNYTIVNFTFFKYEALQKQKSISFQVY